MGGIWNHPAAISALIALAFCLKTIVSNFHATREMDNSCYPKGGTHPFVYGPYLTHEALTIPLKQSLHALHQLHQVGIYPKNKYHRVGPNCIRHMGRLLLSPYLGLLQSGPPFTLHLTSPSFRIINGTNCNKDEFLPQFFFYELIFVAKGNFLRRTSNFVVKFTITSLFGHEINSRRKKVTAKTSTSNFQLSAIWQEHELAIITLATKQISSQTVAFCNKF